MSYGFYIESKTSRTQRDTKLQKDDHNTLVALGMRYGNPSIEGALKELQRQDVQKLNVVPLYPQYTESSTVSALDALHAGLKKLNWQPELNITESYSENPDYIDALAKQLKTYWETNGKSKKLIISFHGIPQRTVDAGDPYYDQCSQTAELLAKALKLETHEWELAFQSRFGFEKWLTPYCEERLKLLAKEGIVTVDVICPGFAVDCLETLEEIAVRYKKTYLDNGGKQLNYIPALNAQHEHINIFFSLIDIPVFKC